MTQVFVYDGELVRNRRRTWQGLLDGPVLLTWNGTRLVGGDPVSGDVIVCHRAERADAQAAVDALAAVGVYVVRVAENNRTSGLAIGNTYDRARGVQNPIDPHFAACFKYFLRHLEANGAPEWQLLEGPPPPDALLGYHLLGLLSEDAAAGAARQALAATAIAEAQAIAGATGTRLLVAIDDPEQRREFLRTCS